MKLVTIAAADQGIDPVQAHDAEVVSKIWFKTDPITEEFCHRVAQVQLATDSNDQGQVDDRSQGSWTWFELIILASADATEPKAKGDRTLAWRSHANNMTIPGSRHYGAVFDRRAELLDDLEPGDIIAVRACARFEGWINYTRRGHLTAKVLDDDLFTPLARTLESKDRPYLPGDLQNGVYTFIPTTECHVAATDNTLQSKIWFKSPPVDKDAINRIKEVRLYTTSRHQGPVSVPEAGSWSWFDLVILKDAQATIPRVKDGVSLEWASHVNAVENKDWNDYSGVPFDDSDKNEHHLLRFLEVGNVIGVRVCAQHPGWENHAKNARLIVQISTSHNRVAPPTVDDSEKIMKNQAKIQEAISDCYQQIAGVNQETFVSPTIASGFLRADAIGDAIIQQQNRPLRLLSLDGGGVRGVSSLRILQGIMKVVDPSGKMKPCDYFDLMVGTSTGGLLALMLGRLEMTIAECQDAYMHISQDVFGISPLTKAFNVATTSAQYSGNTLADSVKALVKSKLQDPDAKMFDPRPDAKCKVAVVTTRADKANNAVHIRTYVNPAEPGEFGGWSIWQAARATSAAPAYFPRMNIDGIDFLDGGMGFNNPTSELMTEVAGTFGPTRPIGCLVSIGTGLPFDVVVGQPGINITGNAAFAEALLNIATNSEAIHHTTLKTADLWTVTGEKKYWRFNVAKAIVAHPEIVGGTRDDDDNPIFAPEEVGKLDDWKNMPHLLQLTDDYVKADAKAIDECANRLKKFDV